MEEKFIKILNKKDCTGCRACQQICPVKAISINEDDEGFITPKVDEERCIKCGLCKKTCGQIDRFYNKNNFKMSETQQFNVLQSVGLLSQQSYNCIHNLSDMGS